ncbi:STAS domain-containing protein [Pseudonocardia phyllosphaerae]|uniref:STAS domain-containing protein n=1 Tax=Pseudonocardia phyllosphaerae TaxID=3390502 RepID=UPI00397DB0F0
MNPVDPARDLRRSARTWPGGPDRVQLREHQPRPGLTVLEVTGEIDLSEADAIRERFAALVGGERPPERVVLDLSGVGFLGSHGLTAIVRASRAAREAGVRLSGVTGPENRAVIRPIRMTGLDLVVPWYADLTGALAAET